MNAHEVAIDICTLDFNNCSFGLDKIGTFNCRHFSSNCLVWVSFSYDIGKMFTFLVSISPKI